MGCITDKDDFSLVVDDDDKKPKTERNNKINFLFSLPLRALAFPSLWDRSMTTINTNTHTHTTTARETDAEFEISISHSSYLDDDNYLTDTLTDDDGDDDNC